MGFGRAFDFADISAFGDIPKQIFAQFKGCIQKSPNSAHEVRTGDGRISMAGLNPGNVEQLDIDHDVPGCFADELRRFFHKDFLELPQAEKISHSAS